MCRRRGWPAITFATRDLQPASRPQSRVTKGLARGLPMRSRMAVDEPQQLYRTPTRCCARRGARNRGWQLKATYQANDRACGRLAPPQLTGAMRSEKCQVQKKLGDGRGHVAAKCHAHAHTHTCQLPGTIKRLGPWQLGATPMSNHLPARRFKNTPDRARPTDSPFTLAEQPHKASTGKLQPRTVVSRMQCGTARCKPPLPQHIPFLGKDRQRAPQQHHRRVFRPCPHCIPARGGCARASIRSRLASLSLRWTADPMYAMHAMR